MLRPGWGLGAPSCPCSGLFGSRGPSSADPTNRSEPFKGEWTKGQTPPFTPSGQGGLKEQRRPAAPDWAHVTQRLSCEGSIREVSAVALQVGTLGAGVGGGTD